MPSDDGALTEAHIHSGMTPGQIAEEVIRVVAGPGYFEGVVDGRAGVIGWLLRSYGKAAPETGDSARERLEFLAEFARYVSDLSRISAGSRDDVLEHLGWFAEIASPAVRQQGKMQLAARDQWGFGWGTIANAVGVPRSTVRGQIESARRYYATFGTWFDQDGEHKGTAEEAAAALRAAPVPPDDPAAAEPGRARLAELHLEAVISALPPDLRPVPDVSIYDQLLNRRTPQA